MAHFISIPVTAKGNTLISTEGIATYFEGATSFIIAAGGRTLTLTMVAGTVAALEAINNAITKLNGPTVVPVTFPAGVTCTAIDVA